MLVSIIIPVYNVSAYLEKCLRSVTEQTFKNLEIILVNDGSTDDSGQICRTQADLDSRIVYIEKENGGLSSARNAGLDVMTGDFCLFVDSDDYLEANAVETLLQNAGNADVLLFNYYTVNSQGLRLTSSRFLPEEFHFRSEEERLSYLFRRFFCYQHGWEVWIHLYSGNLIRKHHLRFYDNRQIFAEDLEFNIKVIALTDHLKVIAPSLYNYTKRGDSITGISPAYMHLPEFNRLSMQVFHFTQEHALTLWYSRYCLIHFSLVRIALWEIKEQDTKLLPVYDRQITDGERCFYRKWLKKLLLHPVLCVRFLNAESYILNLTALCGSFHLYNGFCSLVRSLPHRSAKKI